MKMKTEGTGMIVAKFGGTSLADADAIRHAAELMKEN